MALTIALPTLIIITSFKTADGKLSKDDLCLRTFYKCADSLGVRGFMDVYKKLEHEKFCDAATRSLDCLAEKDSKPKLKTIEERITVYDECYGVEFATFKKKDMKIYRLYKNTCRPSVAFALGMEGCSDETVRLCVIQDPPHPNCSFSSCKYLKPVNVQRKPKPNKTDKIGYLAKFRAPKQYDFAVKNRINLLHSLMTIMIIMFIIGTLA